MIDDTVHVILISSSLGFMLGLATGIIYREN